MRDAISSVVIPHGFILDRVERLAQQIVASDPGALTLVCILKGGFSFFSELANAIKRHSSREGAEIPIRLEFIKCESYVGDKSGELKITSLTDLEDFRGQNLLLVEDIVDTGKTLVKLIDKLQKECAPASIKVATMVLKKTERSNGFIPDWVGFAVPDLFIIGFGLDYNEHGREVSKKRSEGELRNAALYLMCFRLVVDRSIQLEHVCVISEVGKEKYAKPPKGTASGTI